MKKCNIKGVPKQEDKSKVLTHNQNLEAIFSDIGEYIENEYLYNYL